MKGSRISGSSIDWTPDDLFNHNERSVSRGQGKRGVKDWEERPIYAYLISLSMIDYGNGILLLQINILIKLNIQFNLFVSDRVSVRRSLPDMRRRECRSIQYRGQLKFIWFRKKIIEQSSCSYLSGSWDRCETY